MKIQYASDLHLEFGQNRNFIDNGGIKPVGDVLVLAGYDIAQTMADYEFAYRDNVRYLKLAHRMAKCV